MTGKLLGHGKAAAWAASPCLPRVLRYGGCGRKQLLGVTSTKSSSEKWRPPFFLLPGAKKVGRHRSSHINGLCLEVGGKHERMAILGHEEAPLSTLFNAEGPSRPKSPKR